MKPEQHIPATEGDPMPQEEQRLRELCASLSEENRRLKHDKELFECAFYNVVNSRIWRWSAPFRKLLDFLKSNRLRTTFAARFHRQERLRIKARLRELTSAGRLLDVLPNAGIRWRECLFGAVPRQEENPEPAEFLSAPVPGRPENAEPFAGTPVNLQTFAFYLPQFHRIAENDRWWGEGFTEWDNVRRGKPLFSGHEQPKEPHPDFGYYDLSDVNVLKKQAETAKRFGLTGFCFYYYWFNGKRLLEKPLDMLLNHPEIDLSFAVCWANEPWTRSWDGLSEDILMPQTYSPESDLAFIADLQKYLLDKRCLRVNNHPVILVYRAQELPDPAATFLCWREFCRAHGVGEIEIWACRTFFYKDLPLGLGDAIDAEVEFPPHWISTIRAIEDAEKFPGSGKEYYLCDYRDMMWHVLQNDAAADKLPFPILRSSMLGWDNTPRRKTGGAVWYGYSPELYRLWLEKNFEYARKNFPPERRFLFINAWNEWGEGTVLEPDQRHGYSALNATARVLFGEPRIGDPGIGLNLACVNPPKPEKTRMLIHCFCDDSTFLPQAAEYLKQTKMPFDLALGLGKNISRSDVKIIRRALPGHAVQIFRAEPAGKEAASLLLGCGELLKEYDFVLSLHTRLTGPESCAAARRDDLWRAFLGNPKTLEALAGEFQSSGTTDEALAFPEPYPVRAEEEESNATKITAARLLRQFSNRPLKEADAFPADGMFFARCKGLYPLLMLHLTGKDFRKNAGLDSVLNRLLPQSVRTGNYRTRLFLPPNPAFRSPAVPQKRLVLFAHFDPENRISEADKHLFQSLKPFARKRCFLSGNPGLPESESRRIEEKDVEVRRLPNRGRDFGAWHAGLNAIPREELAAFDELIFLNNSCCGPIFPWEEMFSAMEKSDCDFWSIGAMPPCKEPELPAFLRTEFLVFRKRAFQNPGFELFWQSLTDRDDRMASELHCRIKLSADLLSAGLKGGTYLPEFRELQAALRKEAHTDVLAVHPAAFVRLRSPLLKKKSAVSAVREERDAAMAAMVRLSDYPPDLLNW